MAGVTRKPVADLSALFDVFVLAQTVKELLDSALDGAPLTPEEYAVYSQLRATPGVTLTQMARQLSAPLTTASDWVRSMTERGHVVRHVQAGDRRSYGIELTASGRLAHTRTNSSFEAANSRFVEILPRPEAQLRRFLSEATTAAREAHARLTGAGRDQGRSTAAPATAHRP
jgi:DNA-binding MarR family transcriptional regulator